ncbi:hypothetical protein ONE63_010239 [Megalurothrips usitatus]|uniref:F-box domain-containing protein n=1 Tax=Megalurothrips usitatus TaxID=439358 RepID=A0AAV7XK10_9NEOP|nr:hypothetical protein ONE63_010239 [Megalurothrips usitatus]
MKMKEGRAYTVDCADSEESGSSCPDDSSNMTTNSEGKCPLKRACASDDEDQRPLKVPRTSSPPSGRDSLAVETTNETTVISTSHSPLRFPDPEPVAGCSKDFVADVSCPNNLKETKDNGVRYETSSADGQPGTQDVEEDSNLPVELMNLSDDVMLIIMSNLKPTDLLNLSSCCQRLSQVASDWSLWTDVDFRPHRLLEGQLERFLPFFSDTTERIATRGFVASKPSPRWRTECLSTELLSSFASEGPELRSFTAEEHCIDANKVKISAFPSTLEYLSLKGCEIINLPTESSYFTSSYRHLPHLKVLVLSDCTWLPAHSIMALSKQPHLEELHLDGCFLIKDCIAYASLAFNLGFPKLKILDLRRTGVSDSELSCLNRSNRLTHLYLEYPSSFGAINPNDEPGGPRACHFPGIISDQGLRSLVVSDKPHVLYNNAQFGISSEEIHVMAPVRDRVSLCKLHTLVARNYSLVTDATLNELHFAQSLRHLDLKGTRITRRGAEVFRSSRPDVTLVTSYDDDFT